MSRACSKGGASGVTRLVRPEVSRGHSSGPAWSSKARRERASTVSVVSSHSSFSGSNHRTVVTHSVFGHPWLESSRQRDDLKPQSTALVRSRMLRWCGRDPGSNRVPIPMPWFVVFLPRWIIDDHLRCVCSERLVIHSIAFVPTHCGHPRVQRPKSETKLRLKFQSRIRHQLVRRRCACDTTTVGDCPCRSRNGKLWMSHRSIVFADIVSRSVGMSAFVVVNRLPKFFLPVP